MLIFWHFADSWSWCIMHKIVSVKLQNGIMAIKLSQTLLKHVKLGDEWHSEAKNSLTHTHNFMNNIPVDNEYKTNWWNFIHFVGPKIRIFELLVWSIGQLICIIGSLSIFIFTRPTHIEYNTLQRNFVTLIKFTAVFHNKSAFPEIFSFTRNYQFPI